MEDVEGILSAGIIRSSCGSPKRRKLEVGYSLTENAGSVGIGDELPSDTFSPHTGDYTN